MVCLANIPHANLQLYQPIKQRPLINFQNLQDMGLQGFLSYLSQFGGLVYGNCVSGTGVDINYIEKLMRKDFIDPIEEWFYLEQK